MGNFVDSLSPVFATVLSGVIVYLVGQYFHIIWLNPLQEYKKIRAEIARMLLLHANIYTNVVKSDEKNKQWLQEHYDVGDELRKLAAELEGFIQTLYWFRIGIPSKEKLSRAVMELVGLSNACVDNNPTEQGEINYNTAGEIRTLLKIYQSN